MTSISAKLFKERTGLPSKKEGLFYARAFGLTPNRRIKNKVQRINAYLSELGRRVREHDRTTVNNKVAERALIRFDENQDVVVTSNDLTNKKVKVTRGNKFYIREAPSRLDRDFIRTLLGNMNLYADDQYMMIDITYLVAPEQEGAPMIERTAHYVVNQIFLDRLSEDMTGEEEFYAALGDEELIESIHIYLKQKVNQYDRLEGGFFPYYICTNRYTKKIIPMFEKYQIYGKDRPAEEVNKLENCLIHSLIQSGVPEEKLAPLRLKCKSSVIPLCEVKKFAETNGYQIKISSDKHNYVYGKGEVIKLCLLRGHYFINEEIKITTYAISNFDDIKEEKKWWTIRSKTSNGYYNRSSDTTPRWSNTFVLVKLMMEEGFFFRIKLDQNTVGLAELNKVDINNINLDNRGEISLYKDIGVREVNTSEKFLEYLYSKAEPCLKKKCRKVIDNMRKVGFKKTEIVVPFDFETTTDSEEHRPYMISFGIIVDGEQYKDTNTFQAATCAKTFIEYLSNHIYYITKEQGLDFFNLKVKNQRDLRKQFVNAMFKITLVAHNITYDIQFLMKHIFCYNPVMRSSNKVCGGSFIYSGITYNLKDTWAILDRKLEKFTDFGIKIEKEIMPYDIYTEANVKRQMVPIADALACIKTEADRNQFLSNIVKLGLKVGKDNFRHMAYARFYCERDVNVMMEGYNVFRGWSLNDFGIDINEYLTISSIADQHFKKEGCYDGCKYICGVSRYYIQKTVVGGRCMSRRNQMYDIREQLNDFDGVSLYPSAMKRLGEIGGYLRGSPKVIKKSKLNLEFLNKVDGYFIRIRLNKIGKRRDFPLISYVSDKGIRTFTNDLNDENRVMFVNKISLEDIMEFHEVTEDDFDILDGYYFDEGRNGKIKESIEKVFNMRLVHKQNKNPVENLYKLIMNSSYGKTIMKEQNNKVQYIDNCVRLDQYVSMNHNNIVEYEKLHDCDKYIVKTRIPVNDHFNACHIGSEILAMSKRIMNEVMCLAEDNGIKIYYQDTDSMHIQNNKISATADPSTTNPDGIYLADLFREKYKRELIGKDMGQFHCDFQPLKVGDKFLPAKYSKRTIILGKKAYMDVVCYEDNGVEHEDVHYRMKGIPSDIVSHVAKKDFGGDVTQLYKKLYDEDSITFDLLATKKPSFNMNNRGVVRNNSKFTRTVSYKRPVVDSDETVEDIFENIEE